MTSRRTDESAGRGRWALLIALFTLSAGTADAVSTSMALDTGRAIEGNPLIAALQSAMGPAWVGPKLGIHAVLAALVIWTPTREMLAVIAFVALIAAGVSVHNFAVYWAVVA